MEIEERGEQVSPDGVAVMINELIAALIALLVVELMDRCLPTEEE